MGFSSSKGMFGGRSGKEDVQLIPSGARSVPTSPSGPAYTASQIQAGFSQISTSAPTEGGFRIMTDQELFSRPNTRPTTPLRSETALSASPLYSILVKNYGAMSDDDSVSNSSQDSAVYSSEESSSWCCWRRRPRG